MISRKNKRLAIMLMLLTHFSQAVVYAAMPCQKSIMVQSDVIEMVDHSAHNMGQSMSEGIDNSDSKMASSECCDQKCDCLITSCGTAVVPTSFLVANSALASVNDPWNFLSFFESQISDSLFRPPISR